LLSTVAFAPQDDNSRRLAAQVPGVAIADYRIICVVRGTDGDLATSDHGAGDQLDDLPPCC
jgi:hypothetical protein